MFKKGFNIINSILIVVLLVYLFFCNILFCYGFINNDFISNGLIVFGIVGIVLYLLYRFVNKTTKIWDLLILIMIFLGYLSYYNAYDKNVALRGFFLGREGLAVIISYYVFFLIGTTFRKNEIIKNVVIKMLTIFGVISVFYGYLQLINLNSFFGIKIVGKMIYSSSFFSNSNYFGTFSSIMVCIWLAKYFFVNKDIIEYKSFIILCIFIFGLICSGAMSAFVMLALILIICFVVLLKKKVSKKIIVLKYCLLMIFLIFSFAFVKMQGNSYVFDDVLETSNQAVSILNGKIDDNFGTGRIYIWKQTFKYLDDYIYTGIGIDNFAYLGKNDGKYIYDSKEENNVIYKAHNEYLQILATQGIFMLIVYLVFLFLMLKSSFDNFFINNNSCFFISILGYIVQAFFNISMTRIASIFFLLCGLLVSSNDEKNKLF